MGSNPTLSAILLLPTPNYGVRFRLVGRYSTVPIVSSLPFLMLTNTIEQGFAERENEKRSPLPFRFHHIPELDGFRGLAVLLVVVGHYLEYRLPVNTHLATLPKLGVLLFFVLSGFLITGLLYRERLATGKINLRFFYIRRILRLAPAFLLFIVVTLILMRLGLITDV